MGIETGIIIGIGVIVLLVGWYLLSLLARGTRTIITFALTAIVIILGGYVTFQYKDLQKNLGAGDKQFVLVDNNHLIAAFSTSGQAAQVEDDLNLLRVAYDAGDLTRVRGAAASLLIFSADTFSTIETINVSGTTLSRDAAITILRSSAPRDAFVVEYASQRGINASLISGETLGTEDSLRGVIFATMIAELTRTQNVLMLIRNDQVRMDPSNLIIRLLKEVPDSLLPYFVGTGAA